MDTNPYRGDGPMPTMTRVAGSPALALGAFDLTSFGYTVEEVFVRGVAAAYVLDGEAAPDGHWRAKPAGEAAYATRLVVVRPSDPARFNGAAAVEWLNVSGGTDGAADWLMAHRELMRSGYAWIGVSAQKVGVEGGPSLAGMDGSLKTLDPVRYGELSHPGDAYAFDIFAQAGRLARRGGLLPGAPPQRVFAVGESQSATFLTTYVNAMAPLARVFDGYLIHSRFGPVAAIDGRSIFEAPDSMPRAVRVRTDLDAPVLTIVTESDVVGGLRSGYWSARQPDIAGVRTWEVAGSAHADTYVLQVAMMDTPGAPLEQIAAGYAPSATLFGLELAKPVNSSLQHHYVVQAGVAALDRWMRTGEPAASAPPLELSSGDTPALVEDAWGLAKGGLRTPWVDAPIARLSGVGNFGAGPLGGLFGVTEAFDVATLAELYPGGKTDYLQRFERHLDAAVAAGVLLSADRQEILALADLMYPAA
jgi:hypothetical protein